MDGGGCWVGFRVLGSIMCSFGAATVWLGVAVFASLHVHVFGEMRALPKDVELVHVVRACHTEHVCMCLGSCVTLCLHVCTQCG